MMLDHGQRDQTAECGYQMIEHPESFRFKCEHSPCRGYDLPLSTLTSFFQNACVEFIDLRGRQTTKRPLEVAVSGSDNDWPARLRQKPRSLNTCPHAQLTKHSRPPRSNSSPFCSKPPWDVSRGAARAPHQINSDAGLIDGSMAPVPLKFHCGTMACSIPTGCPKFSAKFCHSRVPAIERSHRHHRPCLHVRWELRRRSGPVSDGVKIKSRSDQAPSNSACRELIFAASRESPTQALTRQYAEQVRGEAGEWLSTVRAAVTNSHKPRREPEGFFSTYVQLAGDETARLAETLLPARAPLPRRRPIAILVASLTAAPARSTEPQNDSTFEAGSCPRCCLALDTHQGLVLRSGYADRYLAGTQLIGNA